MKYTNIIVDNNSDDFIERVMKENMWSRSYTLEVIEEYKKFIYLGTYKNVAPSFPIDQVWHTHMLFSEDYQKMCIQIGFFFHHRPNRKNGEKSDKDDYQETKERYHKTFGYKPPKHIWTDFHDSHYVYLDLHQHWVVPVGDKEALKFLLNN